MTTICFLFAWTVAIAASAQPASTVLGVDGTRFTVNGTPVFLLGFSYYGGLGATQEIVRQDLDAAQRHGFNWLRVWATWGAFDHDVSAVGTDGRPREPFFERLRWLVAECDRRGFVVDVTLTHGRVAPGASVGACLPDFESHQRAVETLVAALKTHRNWYLDLANERDVRDDRYVPPDQLKSLRESVRWMDRTRLVTASIAPPATGLPQVSAIAVRCFRATASGAWSNSAHTQLRRLPWTASISLIRSTTACAVLPAQPFRTLRSAVS